MDISEKIRQLRKQKGISQSKMAEVIGISQAAYAKIETGDTKSISIEIGKGISKALNIPFNDLFDIEVPENRSVETEKELNDLKSETEKLQKLLVQLVIIIHTKDIMIELMSFDRIKSIRNNRQLQIEKLSSLIEIKKIEIKEDLDEGIYTIDQFKSVFNIMNRSGNYFNLLEDVDIEKILNKMQFNLFVEKQVNPLID